MRNSICRSVLLASAGLLSVVGAWAQQNPAPPKQGPVSTDLAFTYSAERGEQVLGNCGCFWLQGVGVDAGFTFWKGLAIAASFNSGKASNVAPGVDLSKIQFAAGPRYTYTAWTGRGAAGNRRLQLFGQGLFGDAHFYNGAFPTPNGLENSGDSFALEAGGGLNLLFSKSLGVRLLEADYVRTSLPNNAANRQNDLRIAAGITWHIGR
ncbi:MAG: hypothetical protein ABSA85_09280 [Terracidiphilus sp.]